MNNVILRKERAHTLRCGCNLRRKGDRVLLQKRSFKEVLNFKIGAARSLTSMLEKTSLGAAIIQDLEDVALQPVDSGFPLLSQLLRELF